MYEGMSQAEVIRRLFGRPSASGERVMPPAPPRSTVEHDSVDKMQFGNHVDDSPRFRRIAVEDQPQIAPDAPDPDPIDFTQATPTEIQEWQTKAREAKAKREAAPPYDAWEDLTRDIFYSYHHSREPGVKSPDEVDPAVAHHAKIASRMVAEDEHAQARNLTRDDPTAAAIATMAASRALREALEDELIDQARESEDFEEARDDAEGAQQALDDLRQKAKDQKADQGQVDPSLVSDIKDAVVEKRAAQAKAAQIAQSAPSPMSMAGHDAIVKAVAAAHDAAKNAANVPSFGQGFGSGEPRYESPEQALTIADMWANNPTLKAVSELYGRIDRDMRFKRAKRVVGGADEIVDLKFGDDLRRILSTELGALADDDFEDDFYMRFLGGEVRVFDTVGEEDAGKGPIVLTCDESYSMNGERNIWAKALALALLNITRREKRDFAYVAWASGGQCKTHLFKAKEDLNAQAIVDMASHFFGGGTTPVLGLAEADRIMSTVPEFRKADVVKLTDGEAAFGPEDKRLRDRMAEKGVRFHGVGVGNEVRGGSGYLNNLTDDVVHVRDFDLDNPSEATAHLATHIT